ncbi:MAG: hypothetical protein V4667_03275 [Bacteroidota bacterium]
MSISAQEKEKSSPFYLQLFGIIKEINIENGKSKLVKLEGAIVEVIDSDNKEIFHGVYDAKKRLAIKLPLSQNFTVIVSKEGYVSKCFVVNTIVANQKLSVYNFPFEVILFKKIEDLNVEIVDPVAIVQFFSKESKFDYDYEYTEQINAILKQKYQEYYITEDPK